MSKKIIGKIKIQIKSAMANPSPPVGPALGQKGINIMDFCKEFNKRTQHFEKGSLIPVKINVFSDKSFDFSFKKPSTSFLIKKELKNNLDDNKSISFEQIEKIANYKITDLNVKSKESAIKTILGTLKSMKLNLKNEK